MPNWVTLVCAGCETEFTRTVSNYNVNLKNGCKRFYCSNACKHQGFIDLTCFYCMKDFVQLIVVYEAHERHRYKKIFCSKTCNTEFNRKEGENERERRFWEKVDKTPGLGKDGDCWEWRHQINKDGYGLLSQTTKNIKWLAHIMSYTLAHRCDRPPKGIFVCHTCDNRKCVNPDHLFLGNIVINTLDMVEKGRQAKGTMLPQAKLTENAVRTIRALFKTDSEKYYKFELARLFNVSFGTINRVIQRKSWKHV